MKSKLFNQELGDPYCNNIWQWKHDICHCSYHRPQNSSKVKKGQRRFKNFQTPVDQPWWFKKIVHWNSVENLWDLPEKDQNPDLWANNHVSSRYFPGNFRKNSLPLINGLNSNSLVDKFFIFCTFLIFFIFVLDFPVDYLKTVDTWPKKNLPQSGNNANKDYVFLS